MRIFRATMAGALLVGSLVACTPSDDPAPDATETATATASCTVGAESEEGGTAHTIEVDGVERSYRVYAPDDAPEGTPIPVVYVFHPLGASGEVAAAYTGFPAEGRERGFLVVAPESGPQLRWDFLTPSTTPGSDLAFARAVMTAAVEEHCADPDRQYVTGMSNGSAMSFAIACEGDFPVRAYASVAAIGYASTCQDAPPTSFLYIHGTGDKVVPFEGGETPVGPTAPVAQSLSAWAAHNECEPEPVTSEIADDVERWLWRCPEATIDTYVIDGGGHSWPGAQEIDGLGPSTDTIDATQLILKFFELA